MLIERGYTNKTISIMPMHSVIVILLCIFGIKRTQCSNQNQCGNVNSDYDVIYKLVKLEENVSKQEQIISDQRTMIDTLAQEVKDYRKTFEQQKSDGSTCVRWGRTICPGGAIEVYTGYTAGAHYTHSGGAAKPVCLTSDPTWEHYTPGEEPGGAYIYGAEYETIRYSKWSYLHNHDVPCVVCLVPHNHVLLVPGSKVCPKYYTLQYHGYLMAGNYDQKAASDYICVDGNPETVDRSYEDKDGYLLYFVQAQCGSLSCGPYIHNAEITCAVCTFS